MPRKSAALILTIIILLSTVAVTPTTAQSGLQTFNASNNVDVWTKSMLPLRGTVDDASTSVTNPSVKLVDTGRSPPVTIPLQKYQSRVISEGTTYSMTFDSSRAYVALGNPDVHLVAARMTGGSGNAPGSLSEATGLLDPASGNQNATYTSVSNTSLTNGAGTFNHTPEKPGHYTYLLLKDPGHDGVSVTNGTLSITDSVTLLGVDGISVHRAPSEVTPSPSPLTGESIQFHADASDAFGPNANVTHVVAVYRRETFVESQNRIKLDSSSIDESFNLNSDTTLNTSIGAIHGDVRVQNGVTVNGVNLSDATVSRQVGLASIADFATTRLGSRSPGVETGNTTLNASVTAVKNRNAETTVTVGTRPDWTPGTYQYIHIAALSDNKSAISTDAGTIRVFEPDVVAPVQGRSAQAPLGEIQRVSIGYNQPHSERRVAVKALRNTNAVPPMNLTGVNQSLGFYSIDAPQPNGSANVTFTVPQPQLNGANPQNVSVTRYNEATSKWQVLPSTSRVGPNGNVHVSATTPGFSTFGLASIDAGGSGGSDGTTPTPTPAPGGGSTTPSNTAEPSSGGGGGGGGGGGAFGPVSLVNARIIPSTDRVMLNLNTFETRAIDDATFTFENSNAYGELTFQSRGTEDPRVGAPSGTVVEVYDVSTNKQFAEHSVRLTLRPSVLDKVGVSSDDLVLKRYNVRENRWETVPTTLETGSMSNPVLVAQSEYLGTFAIATPGSGSSAPEQTTPVTTPTPPPATPGTPMATDAPEPTPQPTPTPTQSGGPGFGHLVAVVALFAAALVAARRNA